MLLRAAARPWLSTPCHVRDAAPEPDPMPRTHCCHAPQIWQWGEPWGDFSMTIDRTPHRIDATGDFVGISCGAFHNLALNSAG